MKCNASSLLINVKARLLCNFYYSRILDIVQGNKAISSRTVRQLNL